MFRGAKKHLLAERDPEQHVRMADGIACYVYVLPCRGEDILKVGFSRDPLGRMQALHARYFEFFDLDRALLVATESVRDARKLEGDLFEEASLHNAPAPLLISPAAGGHTEWYRGAYPLLREAAQRRAAAGGYILHAPLRAWLHPRLEREAASLYESTAQRMRAIETARAYGTPAAALERELRNLLDAFAGLDVEIALRVPANVLRWYRAGLPG